MTTFTRSTRSSRARQTARSAILALAAAGAFGSLAAESVGADIKPMLVLDERLELRPIQVAGVSQMSLHEVDARGQVRARPIGDVLALLPRSFDNSQDVQGAEAGARAAAAAAARQANQPWVTLVDGQQIVGAPEPEGVQEDALAWRHDTLGPLVFRLERVMQIVFAPEAGQSAATPVEPPDTDDVVVLRNGDRLRGFVVRVQPDVAIETEGQTLAVPIDRVARVELVNERERASGTHLWLTDGTRIGVHSLAEPRDEEDLAGGLKLHLESPSESPLSEARSVPLHELAAIAFDAGRLAPLTDLPMEKHEPATTRRTGRPPAIQRGGADSLGAGDVLLPGPMTVNWALPEGTIRLAGWVTLPETAFVWGDCNVTFETVDEAGQTTEAARAHLRGMTPMVRINEELPPDAVHLRVTVEAGEYGAVQDRVVLQRFILLTTP